MNKNLAILIAIAMMITGLFSGSVRAMEETPEYEVRRGVFTEKYYREDSDSYSMIVQTDDGNLWSIDNYVFRLLAECEITFDTMGTADIEDDVIIEIITKTVF